MTITDRTTETKGVPMDSLRKTALIAGVFYVITFVSIPTLALYGAVQDPNYMVGPGPDTPVILGGVLEIIVALAGIGTAVVLYPVVKRQGEARAMGFVGTRVLEAAAIFVGVASLLTVVTLRQAGAGADGLVAGQALVAFYDRIFVLGQSLMPVMNALLLGSLLYQSRPVAPRPPNSSLGGPDRSGPLARLRHRHAVRLVGQDVPSVGAACNPDRAVGVLTGCLPDRQGLQALSDHSWHDGYR